MFNLIEMKQRLHHSEHMHTSCTCTKCPGIHAQHIRKAHQERHREWEKYAHLGDSTNLAKLSMLISKKNTLSGGCSVSSSTTCICCHVREEEDGGDLMLTLRRG